MDNRESAYQKKKKARDLFRKVVINVVIWTIIVTFVATLGVYWGNVQQVRSVKIAEINGKTYTYEPGSPFLYIYSGIRQNLAKKSQGAIDAEAVDRLALSNSLDVLLNFTMMLEFANKVGIKPARETIQEYLAYMVGGNTAMAGKGVLEYVNMEYANVALSGNNGDVLNAFAPVTYGELYSYFDLVNFTVDADILYLNADEFVSARVPAAELAAFYQSNLSRFADFAFIDEITVSNKALAAEIAAAAQSNGWEQAVESFKGRMALTNAMKVTDGPGWAKRYKHVITNQVGAVLKSPVFENSQYHIIRVRAFPQYTDLAADFQKALVGEYVAMNGEMLRKRYDSDIKNAVALAERALNETRDFKAVAAKTGMTYARTGKTAPVNQLLRDDKGNRLDLPVLQNDEIFDFFFSAPTNQVSKTFYAGGMYMIVKTLYRGVNPNMVYDSIDQDIAMRYINFKNISVSRDWYKTLEAKTKYQFFHSEISNFFKNEKM